jgi:FKBP-type peptidyl-prolyl cis-trans isomerase
MRIPFLAAGLLALSVATACLGTSEPIVVPTIETTGFDPSLGVNLATSTKTADGLYYRDITVGTGHTYVPGDSVGVYYVGSFPNAVTFDSKTSGTPFSLKVGLGHVISGFDEGLIGMKVGGVRQLVIPSQLAYGASSNGVIPPYAILVFTVTAVSTF